MAHVIVLVFHNKKNIAKTIHTVVLSCSTKLVKSILEVSQIAQDYAIPSMYLILMKLCMN